MYLTHSVESFLIDATSSLCHLIPDLFLKPDLFVLDKLLHTLFKNEIFSLCMDFDRNEEKSHPFSSVVLTSYEGKLSQLSLVFCNVIIFFRRSLRPEALLTWPLAFCSTVTSGHWEYKDDLHKFPLSPVPL